MLNFLTFQQLDYQVLHSVGIPDDGIELAIRQSYINSKLMKIYGLLDGINDPFYNFVQTIVQTADVSLLKDFTCSSGTITAIDASANTITCSAASTFSVGQIVVVAIADATGAPLLWSWVAYISSINANGTVGTYVVISGTDGSLGSDIGSVAIIKSFSSATLSLATYYVKDVVRIWDGSGSSIRLFKRIKDPNIFTKLVKDPFTTAEVYWYHRGDTIELLVGSTASALGTIQVEYRGKPNQYIDATASTLISLPPEHNQALIDEVAASYLMHVQKPIPQEVAQRMQEYQLKFQAAAADSMKNAQEIKDKRG